MVFQCKLLGGRCSAHCLLEEVKSQMCMFQSGSGRRDGNDVLDLANDEKRSLFFGKFPEAFWGLTCL